ncbi:hypothetical protein [uncultured Methylobacterium sp.]|uniref:hypothetical protein n=1 Tax=uncultured Methylobacterium sp. TaxID=157278 RepID=UPI0035CC3A90
MSLVSHLITCQASAGAYHQEDRAGLTLAEATRSIAGGLPFPLISVHAVDFAAGSVADVTAATLQGAVAWWRDTHNEDVPGCLWTACDAYGVERYEPEDAVDESDEHRLTASDLGLSRAA